MIVFVQTIQYREDVHPKSVQVIIVMAISVQQLYIVGTGLLIYIYPLKQ
jgi:hypothetical protein